jgi:hypothetical protein
MSKTTEPINRSEPEVLDDNPTNWFVQFPDGSTDIVTKSNLNKLLFKHNLWGLLRDGTTTWEYHASGRTVLIQPRDENEYELSVNGANPVVLGPHHKSDLVDALVDHYESEEGGNADELVALYDRVREQQIRSNVVGKFIDVPPIAGSATGVSSGWLINDHLLLTWEGDFLHPDTTSRQRNGSVISDGASENAYKVDVEWEDVGMSREIEIDGNKIRLSNAEMKFLANALWAVTKAPENV